MAAWKPPNNDRVKRAMRESGRAWDDAWDAGASLSAPAPWCSGRESHGCFPNPLYATSARFATARPGGPEAQASGYPYEARLRGLLDGDSPAAPRRPAMHQAPAPAARGVPILIGPRTAAAPVAAIQRFFNTPFC